MPPTPIITKQDILNAGIQLIRENGIRSVNARSLAKSLSCSTKPLFRIYKNMEELKKDIKKELDNYYNDFMEKNMTNENRLLSQSYTIKVQRFFYALGNVANRGIHTAMFIYKNTDISSMML